MPTRDEILQRLVTDVAALKTWVAKLEMQAETKGDPWTEEWRPDDSVVKTLTPPQDSDPPVVREARARLAVDAQHDVPGKKHETEIKVEPGKDDSVTFTVKAPTRQQKVMRQAIAKHAVANLRGLDHEAAAAAYIEGGPLWLHAFDRNHVVSLPTDLRQSMVKDVAITMPESADELGRDILKVTDHAAQAAWAHDNAETVSEERERRG